MIDLTAQKQNNKATTQRSSIQPTNNSQNIVIFCGAPQKSGGNIKVAGSYSFCCENFFDRWENLSEKGGVESSKKKFLTTKTFNLKSFDRRAENQSSYGEIKDRFG